MTGKDGNVWTMVVRYLSMAVMLPATTFVGYATGYGLDYLFSTHFLRIVFLLLGIAAGFINLIRTLSRES